MTHRRIRDLTGFDQLSAFDKLVLSLIRIVIKGQKLWWLLDRYNLFDDAVQEAYEHVALEHRELFIGRNAGYIVRAIQHHIVDFVHKHSCEGCCAKDGKVPSQDLWKSITSIGWATTDDNGDQLGFDQYEATWKPAPEKKLIEDAFAEASDEEIDSDEFQLLFRSVSAKSRSDRAVILGCKPREADAVEQALAQRVRAAITQRMGRLAE